MIAQDLKWPQRCLASPHVAPKLSCYEVPLKRKGGIISWVRHKYETHSA